MEHPKVSIIMPSLNVADYIRESIKSAINQTLKEIEIICVDAGSTDGTLDIIKEFVDKDIRIRLINSHVKSYGYQMNLGIKEAQGEYIGIIETDDCAKPKMYEELYKIAEEQQSDFVKADFYNLKTKGDTVNLSYAKLDPSGRYYGRIINPADEQEIFRMVPAIWGGIYRSSFLKANDIKCNETLGASYQDTGFFFKTLCCAQKIYFVNKAYYMYRRDNMNASSHNPNIVPRVAIEYDYIYNWLKERNLLETFKGSFAAKKYTGLKWGFNKTPDDKKIEYSKILAREMAKNIDNGEYEKDYFNAREWEQVQVLISNPERFYYETELEKQRYYYETELKKLEKKILTNKSTEDALKKSISFRTGRAITWLPRKIRGGVRCFSEHGGIYTLKRLCWHVTHIK